MSEEIVDITPRSNPVRMLEDALEECRNQDAPKIVGGIVVMIDEEEALYYRGCHQTKKKELLWAIERIKNSLFEDD